MSREFDVVVVGAGNAVAGAALAAAENAGPCRCATNAPEEESAGNTRFTAGGIRFAYDGVDDLKAIMPDLTEQEIETTISALLHRPVLRRHVPGHPVPNRSGIVRTTRDAVERHNEMDAEKGIRFVPIYGRQTFALMARSGSGWRHGIPGGGSPADQRWRRRKNGIEVRFGVRVLSWLYDGLKVDGVRVRHDGRISEIKAGAVVLACGGFGSQFRVAGHKNVGWDSVRGAGTRFNTETAYGWRLIIAHLRMGNWSGRCHACEWD
ncbi:MAG: FAD-binding protein [Phyllobacteriaceae bacterium]|nr:FAD-binding protein [Phyllobacteriaceae bacterium]